MYLLSMGNLLSALFIILTAVSCMPTGTPSNKSIVAKKYKIGVIPKSTSHIYWKNVHAGVTKASQELGMDVEWRGAKGEANAEAQIRILVEMAENPQIDAILIAPADFKALAKPIQEVQQQGKPVIIMDSEVETDYVAYVASDNFNGGANCAKYMIELLGKHNNTILVLQYLPQSASTRDRERGFIETIEKESKLKLIISEDFVGDSHDFTRKYVEGMLDKNPQIKGIFASSESVTLGAFRALEKLGKTESIKLIGYDANTALVSALHEGKIDGIMLQSPYDIGYEALSIVYAHLHKLPYSKINYTDQALLTPQNYTERQMREFLNPAINKWEAK